ncbi:amidohydrolase family protein [Emcibacter sp.]|uniref:amidohydrolase family protein n=1 Tax=Emcibacter sp. TaxID=1979954 RepID=UPI002AA70B05|nr:amidohydrolase family protein [Emcibacter sp.]
MKRIYHLVLYAVLLVGGNTLSATAGQEYDIAIIGGRVVDPASGLDAVRNVGIRGNRIVAVTKKKINAKKVIDASERVVSPGFIDFHAHGQSILAGRIQALDGVTTALELEKGVLPVGAFYDQLAKEGRPINYGASVNWAAARMAVLLNLTPQADQNWVTESFSKPNWQSHLATKEELEKISQLIRRGMDEGGIGIGFLTGYAPKSGFKEYYIVTELAAEYNLPTFTHARYLSMIEPQSSFEGMAEIISAAAGTGAHTHIVHLNSISLRDIDDIGAMIRGAQEKGLNITTEAYPYGAGSTLIGAAMFRGEHWHERTGGLAAHNFDVNGERLSEEEFARLQKQEPLTPTVIHFLEESDPVQRAFLDKSVLFPGGVIASDAVAWYLDGKELPQDTWPLPENAWSHPRSAGTYSRFLRQYLREKKAVTLLEAIERVSYGPARILEDEIPQMKKKGRLQPGADADVVIFDPETVTDNATYKHPARPSTGFDYVIVNGVVLVEQGKLDTSVLPGQPVRNTP